jgi:hypothetical protein
MQILDDVKSLSQKLQVAPLKEGEVATFRLYRAGKKREDRDDPTCPEVAQYSGVESITDPFEKTNDTKAKKMGSRIIKYQPMGKNGQVRPVYEPVQFIKGELKIGYDNPGLYQFVMRSLRNGSNRFRKQMGAKGEPLWYLVGADQTQNQLAIEDLKFYAETAIRKCDQAGLKAIALKLNSSPDPRLHIASYKPMVKEDIQAIKLDLFRKAKEYPKQVIYASDDPSARKRVEVYDAITMAVLYMNDKGGYNLVSFEDNRDDEIFSPDPGKDSLNSLIEFFDSEKGLPAYAKFAVVLKKALKTPA